jgi:hypothetical protein
MLRLVALVPFVVAAVYPSLAVADWKFGGHVKYQYTYTDYRADDLSAVLGADPAQDQGLDVRLKADGGSGPWDATAHYEFLAAQGDSLAARRRAAALGLPVNGSVTGLPDDRRRLFDLTTTVTERERIAAVQRLDRLAVGYSTGTRSIRFGRQALSWGNGLVFQPLDFINPFAPTAIDKEYKTGDDMLFAQSLLASGGDVQAIAVPRRSPTTHDVASSESTYAVKLRTRARDFDVNIIAARHFGEDLAGFELARSIGGAVWRFDARYDDIKSTGGVWSFVTNVDYSWTWDGKNYYGYAEYFRSGVGERDRARYATPNAALAARIERGELFTLARDYTALGLQIELHPLFNVVNNLIWNLDDGSTFLQVRGIYDWRQNVQLIAGVNIGFGDRGDEYGGIAVAGTNAFVASGRSIYSRAAYYF